MVWKKIKLRRVFDTEMNKVFNLFLKSTFILYKLIFFFAVPRFRFSFSYFCNRSFTLTKQKPKNMGLHIYFFFASYIHEVPKKLKIIL